jgi:hypothetical protein
LQPDGEVQGLPLDELEMPPLLVELDMPPLLAELDTVPLLVELETAPLLVELPAVPELLPEPDPLLLEDPPSPATWMMVVPPQAEMPVEAQRASGTSERTARRTGFIGKSSFGERCGVAAGGISIPQRAPCATGRGPRRRR